VGKDPEVMSFIDLLHQPPSHKVLSRMKLHGAYGIEGIG